MIYVMLQSITEMRNSWVFRHWLGGFGPHFAALAGIIALSVIV